MINFTVTKLDSEYKETYKCYDVTDAINLAKDLSKHGELYLVSCPRNQYVGMYRNGECA